MAGATARVQRRRRRRRPRTSAWRPPAVRDPLQRARLARWPRRFAVVAGTVAVHAIGLGGFAIASWLFPEPPHVAPPSTERVELRVVEPPPPVEAEVPAAPAPVETPAPPAPRRQLAPPDPIDVAEPAPAPAPKTPERRRIVGLSFESTVSSGAGPRFATGNTRMGSTARTAEEPGAAPELSPNRAATRLPAAGGTFTKPTRIAPLEPEYPELLRARGIEADVVVFVSISASGAVERARVVKGSGHDEFDAAALAAARAQRFNPATRDGVAVPYSLKYTYRFRLDRT